jgi:hypothetical protein
MTGRIQKTDIGQAARKHRREYWASLIENFL